MEVGPRGFRVVRLRLDQLRQLGLGLLDVDRAVIGAQLVDSRPLPEVAGVNESVGGQALDVGPVVLVVRLRRASRSVSVSRS